MVIKNNVTTSEAPPAVSVTDSAKGEGRHGGKLKVAYIMSRFPKLTETFVLFEMVAVERQGVQIELYPLQGGKGWIRELLVWFGCCLSSSGLWAVLRLHSLRG